MAYSVKYRDYFYDYYSKLVVVEILRDGYTGEVQKLPLLGTTPVQLEYAGKEWYEVVQPQSATLDIAVNTNEGVLKYQDLFTNSVKKNVLKVYRGGSLDSDGGINSYGPVIFHGYVLPQTLTVPYTNAFKVITLRAADALGVLKYITDIPDLPAGTRYLSYRDVLTYIFNNIGLSNTYRVRSDFYSNAQPETGDFTSHLHIKRLYMLNQDTINDQTPAYKSSLEVLESIFEGHRIYIANDVVCIDKPDYCIGTIVNTITFDSSGATTTNTNVTQTIYDWDGTYAGLPQHWLKGTTMVFEQEAANNIKLSSEKELIANLIVNHDFTGATSWTFASQPPYGVPDIWKYNDDGTKITYSASDTSFTITPNGSYVVGDWAVIYRATGSIPVNPTSKDYAIKESGCTFNVKFNLSYSANTDVICRFRLILHEQSGSERDLYFSLTTGGTMALAESDGTNHVGSGYSTYVYKSIPRKESGLLATDVTVSVSIPFAEVYAFFENGSSLADYGYLYRKDNPFDLIFYPVYKSTDNTTHYATTFSNLEFTITPTGRLHGQNSNTINKYISGENISDYEADAALIYNTNIDCLNAVAVVDDDADSYSGYKNVYSELYNDTNWTTYGIDLLANVYKTRLYRSGATLTGDMRSGATSILTPGHYFKDYTGRYFQMKNSMLNTRAGVYRAAWNEVVTHISATAYLETGEYGTDFGVLNDDSTPDTLSLNVVSNYNLSIPGYTPTYTIAVSGDTDYFTYGTLPTSGNNTIDVDADVSAIVAGDYGTTKSISFELYGSKVTFSYFVADGDYVITTSTSSLTLSSHTEDATSNDTIRVTNAGTQTMTVIGVIDRTPTNFSVSGSATIAPGNYHDFTVTSNEDSPGDYEANVFFREIDYKSNTLEVPLDVTVTLIPYKIHTGSVILNYPFKYDTDVLQKTVRVFNDGANDITVTGWSSDHFTISADTLITSGNYNDFTITSPADTAGVYTETIYFQDTGANTNIAEVSANVTIYASASYYTASFVNINSVSASNLGTTATVNTGSSINLFNLDAYFTDDDVITWRVGTPAFGNDPDLLLVMRAANADDGSLIDSDSGYFANYSNEIEIDTSDGGTNWNGGDIDLEVYVYDPADNFTLSFLNGTEDIDLPTHQISQSSNSTIRVQNNASTVSMVVTGVPTGHLTIDGPYTIDPGEYQDFTVTSGTGQSVNTYSETVTFTGVYVAGTTTGIVADVDVEVVADIPSPVEDIEIGQPSAGEGSTSSQIRINGGSWINIYSAGNQLFDEGDLIEWKIDFTGNPISYDPDKETTAVVKNRSDSTVLFSYTEYTSAISDHIIEINTATTITGWDKGDIDLEITEA